MRRPEIGRTEEELLATPSWHQSHTPEGNIIEPSQPLLEKEEFLLADESEGNEETRQTLKAEHQPQLKPNWPILNLWMGKTGSMMTSSTLICV